MTQQEIQKLATETYELGLQMKTTFKGDQREYMILAIMGCISSFVNSSTEYSLMPIVDVSGTYFKKLRLEKGLTLRQTEDATGISNGYLSQFENGKIRKPSHSVIIKLLDWYNEGITVKSETNGNEI